MRGVVSFSADPDTNVTIDDIWAQQVRSMGFTFVRTPLVTSGSGKMPTALYNKAFQSYRKAGLTVRGILSEGFLPHVSIAGQDTLSANMARNTTGDQLSSPFIDSFSLRAAAVCRQLPEMEAVYIWNEPNLLLVKPGQVVPPGDKAAALAPDVFAALCWQTAKRVKHFCPHMKVLVGSLSLLPQTGIDDANPYLGHYLEQFYTTFKLYGIHQDWPWDGIALNMENYWTLQKAAGAFNAVRRVMARHADHGILTVGEYGTRNDALDPVLAEESYNALTSVVEDEGAFFQDPGRTPSFDLNNYGDYGLSLWRQNNDTATFERLGDLPWRQTLAPWLGGQ